MCAGWSRFTLTGFVSQLLPRLQPVPAVCHCVRCWHRSGTRVAQRMTAWAQLPCGTSMQLDTAAYPLKVGFVVRPLDSSASPPDTSLHVCRHSSRQTHTQPSASYFCRTFAVAAVLGFQVSGALLLLLLCCVFRCQYAAKLPPVCVSHLPEHLSHQGRSAASSTGAFQQASRGRCSRCVE